MLLRARRTAHNLGEIHRNDVILPVPCYQAYHASSRIRVMFAKVDEKMEEDSKARKEIF